MPAPEQQIARLEFVVREQMKEIDKLREEVERLRTGANAHTTLQAIYRNPASPEGNRIKAAAASLPVEKPKLLSVVSSTEPSRLERWRAYARYRLKEEIILETGRLPAPGSGWDAHLRDGVYQPPNDDTEPPLDLYGKDAIKASHTISSLTRIGRKRNGNGGDEPQS